ncbi:MAG: hypothetical protein ACK44A_16135 [Roseateles sp.]
MSPQRWARRMVLGSMAAAAALVTVALALVVLFRAGGSAYVSVGAWLSLMGDVLLGSAFLRWQLGRRSTVWSRVLAVLAVPVLPALPALLLYGLLWLGITPQRGALWLALQLALTVPMTAAAIRVWSRHDLNKEA